MPKLLWISIISLGIMMVLNLIGGLCQMNFFFVSVGILDGLLIWATLKGYRWTFWIIVILVFGGLFFITLVGDISSIMLSAIFDGLLFVPIFICRSWFFRRD
jgi:hypothetical protein